MRITVVSNQVPIPPKSPLVGGKGGVDLKRGFEAAGCNVSQSKPAVAVKKPGPGFP